MLLLVLADSLLLLFFGWEGVGLCSYLLIGFWYRDPAKAAAGTKAFVTNRIGDVGFLVGLALLFASTGTLDLHQLALQPADPTTLGLAGVALFLGMAGKSAQGPLYVWLPDAMAGPTPVSALIHAATMVTAGVYLFARLSWLFAAVPAVGAAIAAVGLATALVAALFAAFEDDIKRVLAYSTVSQLGFMFIAAGSGAPAAAVFHLVTHACFKACLFLAAGSVLHALDHEQDLRKMGGLAPLLPRTRTAYAIGCVAIAGFPIASGFYSKDEILLAALARSPWLGAGALACSALTAFYMFRSYYLAFQGRPAPEPVAARAHEAPRAMTAVLALLGAASVAAGPVLGWPSVWGGHPFLARFLATALAPAPETHGRALALGLQIAGLLAAVGGWALARWLYRDLEASAPAREAMATRLARPHALLRSKLRLEPALVALARDPALDLAAACAWTDRNLVDRLVDLSGRAGRALAAAGGFVDHALVDGVVDAVSALALASGRRLARLQTGRIGNYVLGITLGVVLLVVVAWFA
jgi:NADH-quinone oxidoreductase subunit L